MCAHVCKFVVLFIFYLTFFKIYESPQPSLTHHGCCQESSILEREREREREHIRIPTDFSRVRQRSKTMYGSKRAVKAGTFLESN